MVAQARGGSGLPPKRQDKARNTQPKANQGKARTPNRQPQRTPDVDTKHKEIINALKKNESIDLDSYKDVLLKADEYDWNLLHRIIKSLKILDQEDPEPASKEVLSFVQRLVIDEPKLFIQENEAGDTPLLEAAKFKVEILFQVINLVIPDNILSSLETPCSRKDQKCPLGSVNELLRQKCCRGGSRIRSLTANMDEQDERGEWNRNEEVRVPKPSKALAAGRACTSACLHDTIDIPKLKEKNQAIRGALETGMTFQTNGKWSCLPSLINARNFDTGLYPGNKVPIIPLESFKFLLQLCPDSLFESSVQDGLNPLQMTILLYNDATVHYSHLFRVIEALVKRSPNSIYFEATREAGHDVGKTAYRLLWELDTTTVGHAEVEYDDSEEYGDEKDSDFSKEEAVSDQSDDSYNEDQELSISESERNERKKFLEKTRDLLKMACIGAPETERALKDKLRFLYWGDAELVRKVSLNLLGESKKLDESYITKAKKRSGTLFETILASVKLPYWVPSPQHTSQAQIAGEQGGTATNGTAKASDPYTGIFDWLWESKVRKIFSVEVDDIGSEPHSNAAIRRSLRSRMPDGTYRDFQVEIFNWKKYDICSETVYSAVPGAKKVYLYSLGNAAVLRSWACSPGLYKMENLQSLVIEIHTKNTNDEEDCRAYEEDLKSKLAKDCRLLKYECIEVGYPKSTSSPNHGSRDDANAQDGDNSNGTPTNDTPSSDDWIKLMKPFKDFMINIANSLPPEKRPIVKVAILDDGASLDDLSLNGGKPQSFRADNVEYWVGPCSHGTMMVNCIKQLCPMAQLYIGRLDDSGVAEKQKFTTESCFKALEWARKMDVDIVSMSWSFKKNESGKDDGENSFVRELDNAVIQDNIIMFASLPDKGAKSEISKYLPVGNEKIIRIGSATMFGEEARENIFADRDFLLPGEEIMTPTGESDKGSSYATAYAAGLAALCLYCLRAHTKLEDFYNEKDKSLSLKYKDTSVTKRVEEAATMGGMRKIFKVLSQQGAKDKIPTKGFFVRPYLTLNHNWGADESTKIKYLRYLGPKILPLD